MEQTNLFDFINEEYPVNVFAKKPQNIKEARTEKQQNNRVSYDVGDLVGGSRKEQHQLRERFEQRPSLEILNILEKESPLLAEQAVTKSVLLSFSLEKEKEEGTEPQVAMIKKLLLQRINASPKNQSEESRQQFTRALLEVQNRLSTVRNSDELKDFHNEWTPRLRAERGGMEAATRYVDFAEKEYTLALKGEHEDRVQKASSNFQQAKKHMEFTEVVLQKPLTILGEKFTNYFLKYDSRKQSLNKVFTSYTTWDDVLTPSTSKKTKKRSEKWKRQIPDIIERKGGRTPNFTKPEGLIKNFGFRSVEYGHYVSDKKASEHLCLSAESFFDLADILKIKDDKLSLNGRLSMAFGARGSGNALGHYEPLAKIINLTRDKGVLAILAHEYAHALDHFIYDASHSFKPESLGYASENTLGSACSFEVEQARQALVKQMFSGETVEYIENKNEDGITYRLPNAWKEAYTQSGDLKFVLSIVDDDLRRRYDISKGDKLILMEGNNYATKRRNQQIRAYKRNRLTAAQAVAWYHQAQTKQRVETIPYPVFRSNYFQHSISMDKGKIGKYWSSGREMFARAFESYIQDRLQEIGRKNDYLVSGTRVNDPVFPQELERKQINEAMDVYIKLLTKEFFV
ncbi:LPD1 domain-containing protein [Alkalihalophilus marmarensis]|uniref:LPD1 domain-containing protein n=1 Tax=Alkalihalophilus marmarensis TaxID=521377 RepID=UPI002DB91637|nr:LPD1 domain-containing protein [Alkalihalophilus marmarensis]MEC2074208.1 hypothetical protein [Alkalihalophilus marmarensis]